MTHITNSKNIISKRIVCAMLAAVMLICAFALTGCQEEISDGTDDTVSSDGASDSGIVGLDGYYLRTASEVQDGDVTVERNYIICLDEELTQAVGTMYAQYSETGELKHYEAVVGIVAIEKLLTYSTGNNGSYFTCVNYNNDNVVESSEWINTVTDPDTGVTTVYEGTLTYYESGVDHEFHEEQYVVEGDDRYLSCVTEREYDENGALASENITNYDEDGNEI